ncbi:protein HYPER-SENSITIVITY-RELATED 4-like isoform X7 [Gossypium arboreum]|uniref:protein HYPER-SENSITIVITY-RELATED 4-like isoform X7 n=1 Tax=Gossypium arboreum TaxID=29729 RepID=UPI0022F1828B|nr:protein HYPER-SENSITIVITY-RELATED 4-like isoform X7 [Gossypium arboreum]
MNSVWALLASIALIRTTLYNYLPEKLRLYISARFEEWTRRFNTDETMVFKDYQSSKMNQLFQAANLYLGESLPTISIPRVTVEKTENVRNLTFSMEKNTEMIDVYENIPMKWKYFSDYSQDFVLQNLLLSTANRSILVIEDIDCSIKLQNRESGIEQPIKYQQQNKVTLSGLLNFFDGILSCCGEGKILVATTNYKDRIDRALLRAGRMDMHIYLTYCTFSAFKQLALRYLEISDHSLFHHIEKLLPKVKVSPAEVAGELMKTRDPKASIEGLIKHLEEKLIADGNSEVSPKHHSSLSQTSNCQVHKSSISLPLACNGASMDNVKSPGPKPDVSVKSKLTADSEGDNNFEKTDLVRDRSSRHNILQVIEDMEKELLSYKEAIIALQKKSCGTLNKLAGIKATI